MPSQAQDRGRERPMSGLPLVGDEFAGYRMRSVFGRGGMSVVYQAENFGWCGGQRAPQDRVRVLLLSAESVLSGSASSGLAAR